MEKTDEKMQIEERKNEICTKWLVIGDTCDLRENCNKMHPMTCQEKNCNKEVVDIGKQCGKIHVSQKDREILEQNKAKAREEEMKKKIGGEKCRDFMNGYCRFGNRCWRKHMTRKEFMKTIECKYYREGRCNRGSRCDYKHLQQLPCKRYSENNRCFKEDSCEFLHIDTKNHTEEFNPIREQQTLVTREEKEGEEASRVDFLGRAAMEQTLPKAITLEERMLQLERCMKMIMVKMDLVKTMEPQA